MYSAAGGSGLTFVVQSLLLQPVSRAADYYAVGEWWSEYYGS